MNNLVPVTDPFGVLMEISTALAGEEVLLAGAEQVKVEGVIMVTLEQLFPPTVTVVVG